jgi:hypothetical protein
MKRWIRRYGIWCAAVIVFAATSGMGELVIAIPIVKNAELWAEWDDIARADDAAGIIEEDHPRIDAISSEARALEFKIVATPAFTRQGFAGKRRVARRADLVDDDGGIAAILQNDAERVVAAR